MDQPNGLKIPVVSGEVINKLAVSGYKSISDEQSIEIKPLTILAGANSSGKSSMMQPLLLLKQTIECSYDPGSLLLQGPHVRFSRVDQLLSRVEDRASFTIGIEASPNHFLKTTFRKQNDSVFSIEQSVATLGNKRVRLHQGMSQKELAKIAASVKKDWVENLPAPLQEDGRWEIGQGKCFLALKLVGGPAAEKFSISETITGGVAGSILMVIHVPAMRGNPERDYPVTRATFPIAGTFEKYTAGILADWSEERQNKKLRALGADLRKLGLTGGVKATTIYAARIQIEVGRLPDAAPDRPEKTVNIADVGFGLSQVLPVLVALHAAIPGQLVYIEEPEIHLHPRAQYLLGEILVAAANRGVQLVIETHSSLLLLGIQTLVAEGKIAPEKIGLHWFQRDRKGRTVVRTGEVDVAGRFGDWPEDFDDVSLRAEASYLDAAELRMAPK